MMSLGGYAATVVSSFLAGVFATVGFALWAHKKMGGDE